MWQILHRGICISQQKEKIILGLQRGLGMSHPCKKIPVPFSVAEQRSSWFGMMMMLVEMTQGHNLSLTPNVLALNDPPPPEP